MLAWALVGGGVVTSLLTLYVMGRVYAKVFWRPRAEAPEGQLAAAMPSALLADGGGDVDFNERADVGRMPAGMVAPTIALIGVGLSLTVLAGPIFGYSERAAAQLFDRHDYISAVMGEPT